MPLHHIPASLIVARISNNFCEKYVILEILLSYKTLKVEVFL